MYEVTCAFEASEVMIKHLKNVHSLKGSNAYGVSGLGSAKGDTVVRKFELAALPSSCIHASSIVKTT